MTKREPTCVYLHGKVQLGHTIDAIASQKVGFACTCCIDLEPCVPSRQYRQVLKNHIFSCSNNREVKR